MAIINNTIINGKLHVNGNINASVVTASSFIGALTGTATNATSLNGKAEAALSVSYAATAGSATSLNGKAEAALSVSYATYASRIVTTANSANTAYFIPFTAASTSDTDGASLLVGNLKEFTFNPSTGLVVATTFSGSFSGNATSATTAASLTTSRNLTIIDNNSNSGTATAFKGNADISIPLPTTINANNFTVSKAVNIIYNSASDCLEVVFL